MNTSQALAASKDLLAHIGKHLAAQAGEGKDNVTAKLDTFQAIAYDYAWIASEVYAAEPMIAYAEKNPGEIEKALAEFFVAETVAHFSEKVSYRFHEWGVDEKKLRDTIWKTEITKDVESVLNEKNYGRIAQLIHKANHGGGHRLGQEQETILQKLHE